jgi:hypothetical protein
MAYLSNQIFKIPNSRPYFFTNLKKLKMIRVALKTSIALHSLLIAVW